MRKDILALGLILFVVGLIVAALSFIDGLKGYTEALQVCGTLLALGGIGVMVYGGVSKPPTMHMMEHRS